MKLPQNINKVYRQGRTDALATSGISPSGWWSDKWDVVKDTAGGVWDRKGCLVKCASAPGGKWGKAACAADCI